MIRIGVCVLLFAVHFVQSIPNRRYDFDDEIPTLVEAVSPFDNPSERYEYHHLPWPCQPKNEEVAQDLGSEFNAERAQASKFEIRFRRSTENKFVCKNAKLSGEDVDKFIHAIDNQYQFEMRVDDLLVVGAIGLVQKDFASGEKSYFLLTHRAFNITYNDDRVITCHPSREVTKQQFVELFPGKPANVQFSYSVQWSKTSTSYADRLWVQPGSRVSRRQLEAHWMWIMNSCMLIVLLTCLFSVILLRVVKNDVARYLQLDQLHQEEVQTGRELEDPEPDETGWKRIQFDVFRPPSNPLLFSSIVGVGTQLLMVAVVILMFAIFGYFYPGNHGRIYVAFGVLYCVTAYVAGYVASAKMVEIAPDDNVDWMKITMLTSGLFCGPLFFSFAVVNTVAITQDSIVALPFGAIATTLSLWLFVTLPLNAVGARRGSKITPITFPCRVKRIARPLPEDSPWYYNRAFTVIGAGFLPFMSIYVELGTMFVALWGHTAYTLFGILLATFGILLAVTSFMVVLLCYFQLVNEDYRWWWISIFRGAGCGLFMYVYAVYYWFYQSHMSGILQGAMFFLYSLMIAYAFSLMLGAVGHWTSRWFVLTIYRAIKSA